MSESRWVEHTKKYAATKHIAYKDALSDPVNRLRYHKTEMAKNGCNVKKHSTLSMKTGSPDVTKAQANLAKAYNTYYKQSNSSKR